MMPSTADDPITENIPTNNKVITRFKNDILIIISNISKGLKVEFPRTSFCIQPEKHKERNPSTSVISSSNCRTSKIFEDADFYLHPKVKQIPSYVKDTTNFLINLMP